MGKIGTGSPWWEVLLNKGLKDFTPGMSRCCTWELPTCHTSLIQARIKKLNKTF